MIAGGFILSDNGNANEIPVPAEIKQYEMWQRPPSRQKMPNQAQNLDDDPNVVKQRGPSGRPRIDFFQNRILQVAKQGSSSNDEDITPSYAAMS